jgi:hypothetical protein
VGERGGRREPWDARRTAEMGRRSGAGGRAWWDHVLPGLVGTFRRASGDLGWRGGWRGPTAGARLFPQIRSASKSCRLLLLLGVCCPAWARIALEINTQMLELFYSRWWLPITQSPASKYKHHTNLCFELEQINQFCYFVFAGKFCIWALQIASFGLQKILLVDLVSRGPYKLE